MDQETTYVGIDVAKAQLDVAVRRATDGRSPMTRRESFSWYPT